MIPFLLDSLMGSQKSWMLVKVRENDSTISGAEDGSKNVIC